MAKLEFWYEFASPYSYLSVTRVAEVAAAAGVEVDWCPFLLGPIFKAQGWSTSPFNLYPAKGRYMVRDIERMASARGLTFRLPEPFPSNGLKAARLALLGKAEGWCAAFTRAVFDAAFARGEDIASIETLRRILADLGLDVDVTMASAGNREIKDALRRATERAKGHGIFGAPSFLTEDGELFWGDDRLEQALDWAKRR